MIDNEKIKRARQADLAEYLLSVGVPLIRVGSRHKHKEHDSLIFTKNAYYWNSRQEHGNAIDYIVKHMGMSFSEAVVALVKEPTASISTVSGKQAFDLSQISLCHDTDKVKIYLNKSRFIGYDVINHLIKNRLLLQEKMTNNAVFPIYDENNTCVGAELQGTTQKRFKGIKSNSKYGYGFNVRFSDDNTFDYALFFESAVDLMSFIDYKQNHEKKSLNKCILISMAGLKLNIVKHTLKAFKGNLRVVVCVDNDNAGRAFMKNLDEIRYITSLPEEKYKDWNEQVIETKRNNKPIARLFKSSSEIYDSGQQIK